VVEPGQLYRGGYTEPWPLKRLIEGYGVRHILCLMNFAPGDPRESRELKIASETGVTLKEIPMPGNGCADFASLDAAADYIADPAHRPLFVHCAAGVQRTGAAIAAYRMKHCGWTYDRAIAEAEHYGLSRHDNAELYEHLRGYSESLAGAATRPATAASGRSPASAAHRSSPVLTPAAGPAH
ncbi:MAG: protein-tyrosine phosphatase family protein, partial [Phycisphaerae bacterium]